MERQLFDATTTPYDAELAGHVYDLGQVADDPGRRSDAIRLLFPEAVTLVREAREGFGT